MSNAIHYDSIKRGSPLPGGLTRSKEGLNFSIFARHATRVRLVLDWRKNGESTYKRHEIEFDPEENRTGDMWHILLAVEMDEFSYGFRVDGPEDKIRGGQAYDFNTILIDPYSRALLPRKWGDKSSYGEKPCCRGLTEEFDWQKDRPLKTPLSETIIYELHVRGFTNSPSSNTNSSGTYLGVTEKIPYLKDLGVTAVELLPITEFDENDTIFHNPETGERLKNFWGYSPVSFFAINSGYADDPKRALFEFKTMVRALHQAGIEVYLDMVYNHTGEGGYDGTTCSFRGLDNSIYYLLDRDGQYQNFSGCGNTLNCNHPVVRDLIRESLHYWVTEMHIDGFRFDLASILGRDQEGKVLANPPMIEIIGQDPVLRDTKMIAEAWDAAGLYQVGSFSTDPRWAEWNGRFRDDLRAFMSGQMGTIAHLATRIAGSSDLYQTSGRTPLSSINFITSHDGFTLYDLVSFNTKQNLSNGENNRDGENHNLSWNSGTEGTPASEKIQRFRLQRMKSFAVLLLLSQGVPMICAGDEFGRTQMGNNNAWGQDNGLNWIDWSLLKENAGLHNFFRQCISLRKKHDIFRREDFFTGGSSETGSGKQGSISWQYLRPGEQNWNHNCHGLAFTLSSNSNKEEVVSFFAMFNGSREQTLSFTPPAPAATKAWRVIIDTQKPSPGDITSYSRAKRLLKATVGVAPSSCVVLQAKAKS